jgi:hypothetical protein
MSETTTPSASKVITGVVRFSYLHVWQPKAIQEGQEPKYSASIIIPKSDKETLDKIKKAIAFAAESGKAKLGGKVPAVMKTPLRDGDFERPEDEAYKNSYFLNANSSQQPGIVDKNREPIMEQNELYSGCYGRASLNFFAFNNSGNKGVACGLNHIMKTKDGKPLDGRTKAEDDFAGIGDGDDDDDDFLK